MIQDFPIYSNGTKPGALQYGRGYITARLVGSIGGSWLMGLVLVRLWRRPWGQKRDYLFMEGDQFWINNKRLIPGTASTRTDVIWLFTRVELRGWWEVHDYRTGEVSTDFERISLTAGMCAWVPVSEVCRRLENNGFLEKEQ